MLFSKPSAVITEITATPVPVAAIFPLRDTVAIFSFDEEYLIAAPFALPSAAFAMAFINADCFSSSLYESKSVVIAVVAFASSVFSTVTFIVFSTFVVVLLSYASACEYAWIVVVPTPVAVIFPL